MTSWMIPSGANSLGLDTPPPSLSTSPSARVWPSTTTEAGVAIAAAAPLARLNQATCTTEAGSGDTIGPANPDNESAFITEECDTPTTYTNICSLCCNVDVITGSTQPEEDNLAYMSKIRPSKIRITAWDTSVLRSCST